jgi:DNA-binding winged helix-turn-helix (wHTH) protein
VKTQIDHILTPETERHFFQEQLLPPLLRGECTTVMWFPHGGVRTQFNFLISHADSFGYSQLGKYRIVYIDPNDLLNYSPEGCFNLMRQKLAISNQENMGDDLMSLKICMENILAQDTHVIFIMSYFDKLLFGNNFLQNLYGLYQIDRRKVHFIFVNSNNILDKSVLLSYGHFAKLLLQNVVYFPILSEDDAKVVGLRINRGYGLTETTVNMLIRLVGGHPSLIYHSLSLINKNSDSISTNAIEWLTDQPEMKLILNDIWNTFSAEEQRLLLVLAGGDHLVVNASDYLLKMNYIKNDKGCYSLFPPIFKTYIEKLKKVKPTIIIDKESEQILVKSLFAKKKITANEYLLLSNLLKTPNKVVSRDRISEILWGDMACEKYSDWAIDQTVFQLRRKLSEVGIPSTSIQTIKGQGYRWLQDVS